MPELNPESAERLWERFVSELENELDAIESGVVDVRIVGMTVWSAPQLGIALPHHLRDRVRALIERQERVAEDLTSARMHVGEQLAALRGSGANRQPAAPLYLDSSL